MISGVDLLSDISKSVKSNINFDAHIIIPHSDRHAEAGYISFTVSLFVRPQFL